MLRVLAAELSDPGRFTRAKAYARDGAVVDIDVEPGVVRAEVQGSRYEPYAAEVRTVAASRRDTETAAAGGAAGIELLVPERAEITTWCTCPDDSRACKHAIAALLVLADEITVEPDLLVRWRSGDAPELAGRMPHSSGPTAVPTFDPLAELLAAKGPVPAVPTIAPLVTVPMSDDEREVAAIIDSAIAVLRRR
jgi:uncharacterized Zn finger protein